MRMRQRLLPFLLAAVVVVLDRLTKDLIKTHFSAYDSHHRDPGPVQHRPHREPGYRVRHVRQCHRPLARCSAHWIFRRCAHRHCRHAPASQQPADSVLRTALAFILGGAFGNLYDRIVNGTVTDFVEVHAGQHYFPAFNVADSAITVGACLLLLDMWWAKERRVSHVPEANIDR